MRFVSMSGKRRMEKEERLKELAQGIDLVSAPGVRSAAQIRMLAKAKAALEHTGSAAAAAPRRMEE
jgi:hypothetical protein